jgi:DNA-directed RNA polymerase specialized sigma24 family protein
VALTAFRVEAGVAEESRNWSRDAEELAASFTVHARDLFGYACVLSDADRAVASDLVQATFEAATAVWCTLRDLPAGQCRDWLRDTLAAAAERRTGHPARRAFVSPSHRRLTELKMARFGSEYDAVAGLDRFAGWLRTQTAGDSPPGRAADQRPESAADPPPGRAADQSPVQPAGRQPASARAGERPEEPGAGQSGIRPASLHAVPDATPASTQANGRRPARGRPAHGTNGTSSNGHGSPGSPHRNGAAAAPGSYGDPVSALYEQHYASLVRLAALLVRDTATAEEIVQDSFVAVAAAWRRRGNTDGALDFLHQSVLNRSRSALRHGIAPAPATGYPSGFPPLLAALGELPARQREVLVLRYYANLSEEQAADTIGISRAAVRRHATLAGSALRPLLDAG